MVLGGGGGPDNSRLITGIIIIIIIRIRIIDFSFPDAEGSFSEQEEKIIIGCESRVSWRYHYTWMTD